MSEQLLSLEDWHQREAINNFNGTWDLIDKKDRTPDEDALMIHKAHASRYHWQQVATATSLNLARGDWQVSHVYALVGMGESAIYHAKRSLDICLADGYGDFDLAFGYEAMARAYSVLGDDEQCDHYLALAKTAAEDIKKADDKTYFLSQLTDL